MQERRSPQSYYRAVARSVGVPEFWVEDAAQDIALATWRDGKPDDATAIRREAIDAARRYGPYTRRGNRRPLLLSLDAAAEIGETFAESLELKGAMSQAFGAMTHRQRRALRRRLDKLPMTSLDSAHASAARRKLRQELAGGI
jgi:hypothetical protein